jgi:hypothetical protein
MWEQRSGFLFTRIDVRAWSREVPSEVRHWPGSLNTQGSDVLDFSEANRVLLGRHSEGTCIAF